MTKFLWRMMWPWVVAGWIAPVYGEDGTLSWYSLSLAGQVRTLIESDLTDNISPSEPKGTPFHVRTTHFSRDGNALSFEDCVSTCDQSNFVWQGGRLAEARQEFGNEMPERTVRYVRDSDGRVVEEQTFSRGEMDCNKRFLKNGSQEEEIEYCSDIPTRHQVRLHDESTGTDSVSVYTYLEGGTTSSLERHYQETRAELENGTVRMEKQYSSGKDTTVKDARGRLLEDVRDFENSYHRETHRYDESGREVEKAEWNRDGSIINRRSYVYLNDQQGNWIRRTEFFWSSGLSEPVEGEVTVRDLDYY